MAKTPAFERKYIEKTRRSRDHIEKSKKLIPGGVESNIRLFSPHPFVSMRTQRFVSAFTRRANSA